MALSKTELKAASKFSINEEVFNKGKKKWLEEKGVTEQQAFELSKEDSEVAEKLGMEPSEFLEQKRADIEMEMAEVGHGLR